MQQQEWQECKYIDIVIQTAPPIEKITTTISVPRHVGFATGKNSNNPDPGCVFNCRTQVLEPLELFLGLGGRNRDLALKRIFEQKSTLQFKFSHTDDFSTMNSLWGGIHWPLLQFRKLSIDFCIFLSIPQEKKKVCSCCLGSWQTWCNKRLQKVPQSGLHSPLYQLACQPVSHL